MGLACFAAMRGTWALILATSIAYGTGAPLAASRRDEVFKQVKRTGKPVTVKGLSETLNIDRDTISKHLRDLVTMKQLIVRKTGQFKEYTLALDHDEAPAKIGMLIGSLDAFTSGGEEASAIDFSPSPPLGPANLTRDKDKNADLLLSWLRTRPGPFDTVSVARETELDRDTISFYLRLLAAKKRLTMTQKGGTKEYEHASTTIAMLGGLKQMILQGKRHGLSSDQLLTLKSTYADLAKSTSAGPPSSQTKNQIAIAKDLLSQWSLLARDKPNAIGASPLVEK